MNILQQIYIDKTKEVNSLKKKKNKSFFLRNSAPKKKNRFLKHLIKKNNKNYNLIAEIKKKSPSAGEICKKFDHVEIAKIYKKSGAKCLSVLTEKKFFGGDINFIKDIKEKIDIPILRKDFIVDEWQIYESLYYKADCILIILAITKNKDAKKFLDIAKDLNLDVIVEVHNSQEVKRALQIGADCIGINNRNLKTLKISLNNFEKYSKLIPKNIVKICESGIKENYQLYKMTHYGADAFLVGEFLMKQKDIYLATKKLIKR